MFVHDPTYNLDVKLNSKPYHFEPENNQSSLLMQIEIKTNLPYYGSKNEKGVRFMSKCKTISNESEEMSDTTRNIQYEFILESQVEVDLNQKFFSLYSTSPEGMKLPVIYEVMYQIKAFREKLSIAQIAKAYEDLSSCLIKLEPESLDMKKLATILMKEITVEL